MANSTQAEGTSYLEVTEVTSRMVVHKHWVRTGRARACCLLLYTHAQCTVNGVQRPYNPLTTILE
jgi:hypothetical protein